MHLSKIPRSKRGCDHGCFRWYQRGGKTVGTENQEGGVSVAQERTSHVEGSERRLQNQHLCSLNGTKVLRRGDEVGEEVQNCHSEHYSPTPIRDVVQNWKNSTDHASSSGVAHRKSQMEHHDGDEMEE